MKIPFRVSLLGWVAIAIAGGILFGQFLPATVVRFFVTFNSLFGNFLSFAIPLIILGLVAPAIGELGKGAGRLLLITALIAYGSTIFSGFFTYLTGAAVFPHILTVGTQSLEAMQNPESAMLTPYFTVAMPPAMGIPLAMVMRTAGGCCVDRPNTMSTARQARLVLSVGTPAVAQSRPTTRPAPVLGLASVRVITSRSSRDWNMLTSSW